MTPELVIDIFKDSIYIIMLFITILILPSLLIGLCISVFQAATQINEQSLSFVPRIITIFVTFIVASPMISKILINYTEKLFMQLPGMLQ